MKKGLLFGTLLAVITLALSSCDNDYWYGYHNHEVLGYWEADYAVDGGGSYTLYDNERDAYRFYSDGTGEYYYYDRYGYWTRVSLRWEDRGGRRLWVRYSDGAPSEYLDYDFDRYGYLLISRDNFDTYRGYRYR